MCSSVCKDNQAYHPREEHQCCALFQTVSVPPCGLFCDVASHKSCALLQMVAVTHWGLACGSGDACFHTALHVQLPVQARIATSRDCCPHKQSLMPCPFY